jgi:hypothetical protein
MLFNHPSESQPIQAKCHAYKKGDRIPFNEGNSETRRSCHGENF